jgi:sugar-specific transcriptional regulator TrmB
VGSKNKTRLKNKKGTKMYEDFLEGTGLTKNESIVYLTLLKIGKAKTGEILKESKISSGKIYETLDKLSSKGLVKTIIENGIKQFIASDPKTLLRYLEEKENNLETKKKELEKILPKLQELKSNKQTLEEVSFIKGFRGISTVVYDALNTGDDVRIMGVRSSKDETFNNFWKNWHKERISQKKNAKLLFSDKDTEYWKFFKKQEYTQVRETLSFSPSAILIIKNNSFIFSYEEEFTCTHIKSESIANSFRSFFDSLWNFSNK